MASDNPFEVTKAVDFTDDEIDSTWVDLPTVGFSSIADPSSPMPCFLVGGKGGGRTHLLRYYSYALQKIRYHEELLAGIHRDRYLGIYFRCGGLNASRFAGKGQSSETWQAVFAYYTDVWLARLVLETLHDLLSVVHAGDAQGKKLVRAFVERVPSLFDRNIPEIDEAHDLRSLGDSFAAVQRTLDLAINNAALTGNLKVNIDASPGRLVFGLPKLAESAFPFLRDVRFAYLIDEFENLEIDQQKYVNTLIREKELPSTFLIGSRIFGLRTHVTLSAGEENRQGSEFQLVVLEETYRAQRQRYSRFCHDIVARRLMHFGIREDIPRSLDVYFEHAKGSKLERAAYLVEEFRGKDSTAEYPWITALRRQLVDMFDGGDEASAIVTLLAIPQNPLIEKFAIFLFYRAWADGVSVMQAAEEAGESARSLVQGNSSDGKKVHTTFRHYQSDLYAQLLKDLGQPQEYYGFDSFVSMSGYLPRNLLIILKQVTRWSLFLGEDPFRNRPVSLEAQKRGIREASVWFLSDAKGLGKIGEDTEVAIRRLGGYLKDHRFSARPTEVSCVAFSTDRRGLSEQALACLDNAVEHSLLIEAVGRKDKNSGTLTHKYQLHPMLSPLFDLPFALRGVLKPSANELRVIFDPSATDEEFSAMRRDRMSSLNPPFRRSDRHAKRPGSQEILDL